MTDREPEGQSRYVLWLCDHCGDHAAESEPGEQCEVCCEGTVREVPAVPLWDGAAHPEAERAPEDKR